MTCWEHARDTILMPRMTAGIAGAFAVPPQESAFEVLHALRK